MTVEIVPQFRSRFTFAEIRSSYPTPEDAWAAGDFMLVSETAPEDSELRACAVVMAGLVSQGLERLERLAALTPRGMLIKAFAFWLLDRAPEALALLDRVPPGSPDAAMALRLRRLVAAGEIRVITTAAVLPVLTKGDESARQPVRRYGQFEVSHYATQFDRNAWPNELNDPFDTFIDGLGPQERPDFIFSQTPQWMLPRNFERVTVPRVLWCHDTDVFFSRAADNLAAFDMRLMCTSQEHFELQHALGVPCMSSLLTEPMCMPPPRPVLKLEKDIDVVFTGAALNVLHSEKPRFLYQLAALSPRYRIEIVDGHIPESRYFDLLARARFLPVVNRYSGQPSPRWLDALAHSCCVLYPEGSGYANVGAGCFAFRENAIAADIASHIEAHRAAALGSPYHPATVYEHTKRAFALRQDSRDKNLERLLKVAAFSALVWRTPTRARTDVRARSVWMTPPIDKFMFDREHIREKIERYEAGLRPGPSWDDRDHNNVAAIDMHLSVLFSELRRERRLRAYALLEEGLARFPQSLLLRFNAAHWRFFESDNASFEAETRALSLIAEFDQLSFSPTDSDVGLPVTYYQRDLVFPFYAYSQLVLSSEVKRNSSSPGGGIDLAVPPARVLLAAAHGYLGRSAERRGDLVAALDRYRQSLAIYADNLPLMRTRLRLLCRLASADNPHYGEEILRAFSECASIYPTVLLSELYQIVPALERTGCQGAIKDLLAMWHRLGNITTFGSPSWFDDQIDGYLSIARFEAHFPDELRKRLVLLRSGQGGPATQFETLVLAATDISMLSTIRRKALRPLRRVIRAFAQVHGHFRTFGLARTMRVIVRKMTGG
jgi:hypothetical protein